MKKALIVLLILAVAGGLFAQITWSGNVQGGIAVGFTDADGDAGKPKLDYIRGRGEHGLQAEVNGVISKTDDAFGSWGANVTFRARQNIFADTNTWPVFEVSNTNLWWQPNSIVYVHIGNGGGGGFGTTGGLDRGNSVMDADGLKIRLTPITGLTLAAGYIYGKGENGLPLRLLENSALDFGAKYSVDAFTAVANFKFNPGSKSTSYAGTSYAKDNQVDFGAGFNFTGLKALGFTKLAADVGAYDFSNSDVNFIGIGESVSYAVGAVSLGANSQQFIGLGSALADFIPWRVRANFGYTASPTVSFGIEGSYAQGRVYDGNWRNAPEKGGVDSADRFAGKDLAYFAISPQVTFKVGPEVILGYNLAMNMSSGSAKPASGAESMKHTIYAGVNVGF